MSFYSRVRVVCDAQYRLYHHAGPGWDRLVEHSKWERVRDRLTSSLLSTSFPLWENWGTGNELSKV